VAQVEIFNTKDTKVHEGNQAGRNRFKQEGTGAGRKELVRAGRDCFVSLRKGGHVAGTVPCIAKTETQPQTGCDCRE
jgi:hypothetical protein